jgi:hypothetical protein
MTLPERLEKQFEIDASRLKRIQSKQMTEWKGSIYDFPHLEDPEDGIRWEAERLAGLHSALIETLKVLSDYRCVHCVNDSAICFSYRSCEAFRKLEAEIAKLEKA